MTDSHQKWSQWLLLFLAALAVPAVSVVLHELGHYLSHAAFGYEINHFAYSGVISGDPPNGVDPEFASGLSFAAGATVSLLHVGLAINKGARTQIEIEQLITFLRNRSSFVIQ